MPSLTERAERALLGALLLDPRRFEQLPRLTPDDFGPGAYRRAFAILEQALTSADATIEAISPDQRAALKQSCPDPDHIPAYAQMVIEAGLRRALLAHALRLEHAAGDLHYQARRLEQAASPGGTAQDMLERPLRTPAGHAEPPVKRLLSHELLVSMALREHVKAFDPDREGPPLPPRAEPGTGTGPAVISPATATWHSAIESAAPARDESAVREERVLASVIQRHHQTSDLPGWLPADVFTSAACQEVFAAIVSLHIRGEPIDDLTTDWERARLQATASGTTGPDTSYAQRLARMPVGPAEAVDACRTLFDDHVKSEDTLRVQAEPTPAIGGSNEPVTRMPDPVPGNPPLLQPPNPPDAAGPQPRMG
jgi:hypothetical protein